MGERLKALIIGASGNVGRACLRVGLAHGWDLVGVVRSVPLTCDGARIYTGDVTSLDFCRQLLQAESPFDLVVMAQGTQEACQLKDLTYAQALRVIDSNLTSALVLSMALAAERGCALHGLVVYCSSIQAIAPRVGRGAYAVAKGGLESLMRAFAVEMAPEVRAVALRLGQLTESMRGIRFSDQELQCLQKRSLRCWPTPSDVANLVFDLYAQPALTGSVIDVSSGQVLNVW